MTNENVEQAAKAEAPVKEAVKRINQNNVTRPISGTLCGQAWDLADNMSQAKGSPVAVADLLVETDKIGLNASNVKAEYSRWRKFHGIEGRIQSQAALAKIAEREAGKAQREAEKLAKAEARKAEKEAKAAAKAEALAAKEAEKLAKAEAKAAEKAAKEEEKARKDAEKAAKAAAKAEAETE